MGRRRAMRISHMDLLSFRLILQQFEERLHIALRRGHAKLGPPDAQARDCVIAFGLRQHALRRS